MKKHNFTFAFLLISLSGLFAQNEVGIWYFGHNAGLKFEEGRIVPLEDGQIRYNEGISSISDCKGNLLLYTDAKQVWNKNHDVMANGSGLMGHMSATQGSTVVPHPGYCDQYYIFTVDARENRFLDGLRYSVVDMSLQNGLGEVTAKNILLHTPVSEKLTAVHHNNGTDMWVIAQEMNTNLFYAYLISEVGIDPNPVISSVGPQIVDGNDAIGQMKVSPDGKRLAYVTLVSKTAQIFDFDNSTGVVSNSITIPAQKFTVEGGLYGLEFSPGGGKLYVTNPNFDYLDYPGNLYQIDLLAGDSADIVNSVTVVGNNAPSTDLRGLQLGPDGRIYVSRSLGNYLGVITNPEQAGTGCNYIDLGVFLGSRLAGWTLPNFVTSFFDPGYSSTNPNPVFEYEETCAGKTTFFFNKSDGFADRFLWEFGDGNFSEEENPVHRYTSSGSYKVTLTVFTGCCSDAVSQEIRIEDCDFTFYVPTSFSPNGDGLNDLFRVAGAGIERIDLSVFNRWGQKVFETTDKEIGWDGRYRGTDCDMGAYTFSLQVYFTNGKKVYRTGYITLIR